MKPKIIIASLMTFITLMSGLAPAIVNADVFTNDNTAQEILNNDDLEDVFGTETQISRAEAAMEAVSAEYSAIDIEDTGMNEASDISKADVYTLTSEDEERVNQAVTEYLSLSGYNPMQRGFGRNWWNSRGFIGGVCDVALIALGIWAGIRTGSAIMSIIRSNRTNITRAVEKYVAARVGIKVGGILYGAINIACTIGGTTVGGAIAHGLDRVDGRYDGYLWA